MNASPCEAAVRRLDDKTIIDLRGDINRSAEAVLTSAYEEATSGHTNDVIFNFSEVGYINSTGIAVIVGLLARSVKEERTVKAYGLSEHYKEIFQITRLSDFMTILTDEGSAVGGTPMSA